ncbi:oxygen-dependent tRNA uridine(34) hydroxylase TrhO [Methyloversatilis thermotolerans]|uniref:oxygen-dependent tRNA uridine(34) hydroxylase TrhO n=1 Tax=Methyloversatilis thermotolerans TaxID=1346290 RepID=UPI00037DB9F3|nr:rhodanese-like domain-containing protein [Methyloversatilis thermotolerans]
MNAYANTAAYRFVQLADREALRPHIQQLAQSRGLLGTVLLASEGINSFLAGEEAALKDFFDALGEDARFAAMDVKWSWSGTLPFRRLRVRLKKEIVTVGEPDFDPRAEPAPYLPPAELKRWYDEGRRFVIIDTRNRWEVERGSFDGALDPGVDSFGQFPAALEQYGDLKDTPIVTFCTGGIRCEKAAPIMKRAGFKQVWQLEGGILRYFEEIGGAHWHGDCVVFDDRGALKPDLSPAG